MVPTWNYATVHAYGTARVVDDAAWLRANFAQLTEQQERRFSQQWAISDAPEAHTTKMLAAIIGIEITVHRFEGKWKLSQNRDTRDKAGVIAGLSNDTDARSQAVADMMREPE